MLCASVPRRTASGSRGEGCTAWEKNTGGSSSDGGDGISNSSTIMMVNMIAVRQCSETCGIGVQSRRAYCVMFSGGGSGRGDGGSDDDGIRDGGNGNISSTITMAT